MPQALQSLVSLLAVLSCAHIFLKALKDFVVSQVACGGQHTLLHLQDGRLFGMGDNEFGQVGVKRDESAEKAIVEFPTQITAFTGIKLKQITCGDEFSVALTSDGEVFTWGRGQYGQLGLGKDQAGPLEKPTKVPTLPSIKKIFAGPNQVFAIEFTDGT